MYMLYKIISYSIYYIYVYIYIYILTYEQIKTKFLQLDRNITLSHEHKFWLGYLREKSW